MAASPALCTALKTSNDQLKPWKALGLYLKADYILWCTGGSDIFPIFLYYRSRRQATPLAHARTDAFLGAYNALLGQCTRVTAQS